MPASPRPPQDNQGNRTRRQFLATGEVVAAAALSGCNGLLGTGPRTLETAVHENSADELSWDFPDQFDAESIGYVEIHREPQFDSEESMPARGFGFNASSDLSSSYELDQFTVAFDTPSTYSDQHGQITYLVSPPTQSDSFNTSYQRIQDGQHIGSS